MNSEAKNWLTISQAARAMGISERQARRYAARLLPEDRREADTATGPTPDGESGDSPAPSVKRPALVRLEAMQRARQVSALNTGNIPTPQSEPDTRLASAGQLADIKTGPTPDDSPPAAGHATGAPPGAPAPQSDQVETSFSPIEARYVAQLESENKFLRGLVEQRDRDAAELRAALRDAMRVVPRQLPEKADTTANDGTAPSGAPDATPDTATGPRVSAIQPESTAQVNPQQDGQGNTPNFWQRIFGKRQ